MFWIFSGSGFFGSSWERYLTELEVHATVKDPALKIMQQSVLIFKMGELDSSSLWPCEPLSNILLEL